MMKEPQTKPLEWVGDSLKQVRGPAGRAADHIRPLFFGGIEPPTASEGASPHPAANLLRLELAEDRRDER